MLTVVLDGITFQHAAELILGWPATLAERSRCCHTYIRSLEDSAFALLFADRVVVPKRMPNVGPDGSPGMILKGGLPDELVVGIEPAPAPIEVTAQDPAIRALTISDLKILPAAVARRPEVWRDFLLRERTYLGRHESLRRSGLPPDGYKFEAEHYVPRSAGLHDELPDVPAQHLAKLLRAEIAPDVACGEAIAEFVRSFLVTHVFNFHSYDKTCEPLRAIDGVRLPHVTRAVIREINGAWESKLSRHFLPHALADALRLISQRGDLVDRLLDLREQKLYRRLREYLLDVLVALDAYDDPSKIESLISDIDNLTRSQAGGADELTVKDVKVGIPAIGSVSLSFTVDALFKRRRYWLRTLVAAGTYPQYREHLGRVFPEMKGC